ncbi:hypothetical protein JXA80_05280 [bacterium]|nr:hypothetical protein [candidate division CSSED10-310 bacterium]
MLKVVLDFILNEDRLNLFFATSVWVVPFLAIVIGSIVGTVRRCMRHSLIWAGFWGSTGALVSGMWFLYNRIMNHYGLDSVKALMINMGIFIGVGLALGGAYMILRRIAPSIPTRR